MFTDTIQPICLPNENYSTPIGEETIVTGWVIKVDVNVVSEKITTVEHVRIFKG